MRSRFSPTFAFLSDGSAFNSPQPDLLPRMSGTESDRWPEGTNVEQLTDAKREIWSGRDGSRRRTGRNVDGESVLCQAAAGFYCSSQQWENILWMAACV